MLAGTRVSATRKSWRWEAAAAFLLACVPLALAAQVLQAPPPEPVFRTPVEFQFYLAGGQPLRQPVVFVLQRSGVLPGEMLATDSRGRYLAGNLDPRSEYTVTVPGDGRFRTAVAVIAPESPGPVRIYLRSAAESGMTVSAAAARRPAPRAASFYRQAQRALGRCLGVAAGGACEAAERSLRDAVAADALYAAPQADLGGLLLRQGRCAEAEETLSETVRLDAGAVQAQLNLGIARNCLRRHAEAIAPLRAALRLDPRSAAARVHLGAALSETGDLDEARFQLGFGVAEPGPAEALGRMALGNLHARTGDVSRAVAEFKRALALTQNPQTAQQLRETIRQLEKDAASATP